ncbi:MAG: lipopolysaccharide heptosyltransferase II [Betaproteobacteria bacterium]|nr:lipopolysaccharide heptosyltransferase II [Betaproteobacteria bacterium]
MTKILIVAPSWVGDAVLAQPLFKRLHERHRDLALDVLAPPWTRALFERMPEINSGIDSPFGHGELALKRRYALGRSLAARRYDQAIVLPNSFKSALIPCFAGIPLRTGFVGEARRGLLNDARRLDKQALPLMAERFAQLAEAAGDMIERPLPAARLKVDDSQRAATLARLGLDPRRPVAILCPGAEYGPAKRWPSAYFAELAQRLMATGYDVWLAGSANDAGIGGEIARAAGNACINLCGKSTLAEAIDLLACAALVVSNDSGLMHIAAALDRPLTAIYGSSSPAFTPPLSARARIVRLDLPCSPCFERACPLGHFNCMLQLTPDRVWRQIGFDKITPS